MIAQPDIITRGVGRIRDSHATRDEDEGLHNCLEFSQPLECLYMRICKHRKKVFYYFYKITFPKKNAKLFVMALIKGEILTSHKVLYTKSCTRNQFRILLKDAFQNTAFSRLKCQLKRKKLTWLVCKDFPSFNRRWNG